MCIAASSPFRGTLHFSSLIRLTPIVPTASVPSRPFPEPIAKESNDCFHQVPPFFLQLPMTSPRAQCQVIPLSIQWTARIH